MMGLPTAPTRKTGLRPIRSDRRAHSGMATRAVTLAAMLTHSMVALSSPTDSPVA